MLFTLKSRFALSCIALTLCLMQVPMRVAAQSPDTPFFAEDLTRMKLGQIAGLDDQVASQARMAADGHMIITGADTDVWVQPGKYIELRPELNISGFTPVTLAVFEDNVRTRADGLESVEHIPMIRIDPPTGGNNRKVVQVAVFDAQRKVRVLMKCIVRSRIVEPVAAALNFKSRNEQCDLNIANRKTLQATYLYLGDIYMGCVGDDADRLQVDERRLPAGKYTCQMVAKNVDNILLPGMSSDFEIKARYSITCADKSPTIVVPDHSEEGKLQVTIKHAPGLGIERTRVYIAGILAGEKEHEKDGDSFTMALPLKDVPTGVNPIEVIGVAQDGTTYPVESIAVKIKNGPWEQRIASTAEYATIKENLPQIKKLQTDVAYWMERAAWEPDFVKTHTIITYNSITSLYAPGKRGEYRAKAQEAFGKLTQLQLETGRLYRKLGMRTNAKYMFYRVVQEAGIRTNDGRDAQKELNALWKERSTSL